MVLKLDLVSAFRLSNHHLKISFVQNQERSVCNVRVIDRDCIYFVYLIFRRFNAKVWCRLCVRSCRVRVRVFSNHVISITLQTQR